jgi:hypothetical protein
MIKVKVLIPFYSVATGKAQMPDDIIEVTEEQLAAIRKVNVNMVLELKADEEPKPKAKKQKAKAEK